MKVNNEGRCIFTKILAKIFLSLGPFFFEKYNAVQLHEELLIAYPELEELPHKTSLIIAPMMELPNNTYALKMSLFSYTIYIPLMYCSILTIYFIVLHQAFRCKDIMSSQTYKNYCILVRAQTIQTFSITIFLFIPYIMQFTLYKFQITNGSILAIVTHFPPSYHLLAEILALFYFVKPYREYLQGTFKKLTWSHSREQKNVEKDFTEFQLVSIRSH